MSFKGAALLVYNIYIYIYFSTLVNFKQSLLSKTRSLDNAIQEFSLAWPSWVINHYTILYKVFLYIVAFCLLLQKKVDIYLSFFRHFSPNNYSPCACWTWDDNSQLGPYRPCWLFVISHAMCTHEIIFEIIIIIIIGFFCFFNWSFRAQSLCDTLHQNGWPSVFIAGLYSCGGFS